MENEEKRMLGDYEVKQSIHIGKKEVVFGVNEARQISLYGLLLHL